MLAKELPVNSLECAQYMCCKNADIRPALTHQIYQTEVILFTTVQRQSKVHRTKKLPQATRAHSGSLLEVHCTRSCVDPHSLG
jgi:hypothetical protein